MPKKKIAIVQIEGFQPLRLAWPQFADLANCCKELSERTTETSVKYESVEIEFVESE